MDISVIIPVFNDSARLQTCLQALSEQNFFGSYEVIVIDNGSEDAATTHSICNQFDFVTFTEEAEVGSYAARNKGLSLATGSVIAFTDSDCIPQPLWLQEGWNETRNSAIAGGDVKVFYRNPAKPTMVELYESEYAFNQQQNTAAGHSVTANLFVLRRVIDQVGQFSTKSPSGGDLEFTKRVSSAGITMAFAPKALILHPARYSFAEYRHKIRRIVSGAYKLREQSDFMAGQFTLKAMVLGLIPPVKGAIRVLKKRPIGEAIPICIVMCFYKYYVWLIRFQWLSGLRKKAVR